MPALERRERRVGRFSETVEGEVSRSCGGRRSSGEEGDGVGETKSKGGGGAEEGGEGRGSGEDQGMDEGGGAASRHQQLRSNLRRAGDTRAQNRMAVGGGAAVRGREGALAGVSHLPPEAGERPV